MSEQTAIVTDGYWRERLDVNARSAIRHQLDELEKAGTLDNFRVVAGEKAGFRDGLFFTDSDLYKWLEAAVQIAVTHPDAELSARVDEVIRLLARAQADDGYLFTFNQAHFPGVRWKNLLIEHEPYCVGHLIEAGVARYQASGRRDLLDVAVRAADCLVAHFAGKGPELAFGHEGVELALLKLHAVTEHEPYLRTAQQLVEQRGRLKGFRRVMLGQMASVVGRLIRVAYRKARYRKAHPDYRPAHVERLNAAKKPKGIGRRLLGALLDGRYVQHHAPVREQAVPEGHAVCFGYLQTGVAMLSHVSRDRSLLPTLTAAWERMVTRRMYVTGGVGSLPGIEGYGDDYELDPEYAYTESCAALATIFWNWEMARLTHEAKYSDLLEWQLYNAAGVGMGQCGARYFYNNPLRCRGSVVRRPWFRVPCCPSNLSRTIARVPQYIRSEEAQAVWLHQYISSRIRTRHARIDMHSELPWRGHVRVRVTPVDERQTFTLHLRLPSWVRAAGLRPGVRLNGIALELAAAAAGVEEFPAQGYDPRMAEFLPIHRAWQAGDCVELDCPVEPLVRRAHPLVAGHAGKGCVTRGPLVYAVESIDNPGIDIFNVTLLEGSLRAYWDEQLLGGVYKIEASSSGGGSVTLIPYHLWGNRGASQMVVWVNVGAPSLKTDDAGGGCANRARSA